MSGFYCIMTTVTRNDTNNTQAFNIYVTFNKKFVMIGYINVDNSLHLVHRKVEGYYGSRFVSLFRW